MSSEPIDVQELKPGPWWGPARRPLAPFGKHARRMLKIPASPGDGRLPHERDFLPAALEIIETPASPLGRVTMAVIMALVLIAFLWACFGKVDIIATATGRIIPSGQVKMIQPFEIGVVKAIHVNDGDHVHAGDLLVELDPTTDRADEDRIANDLAQAEVDAARLTAALAGNSDAFVTPADASPALIEAGRRQLVAELSAHRAKVDGLDKQIAEKIADRNEAISAIAKVQASLPIAQRRADIYSKLEKNEYSSKVAALEAEQQLIEAQHNGALAQHQLEAAEAAISSLQQDRQGAEAEFRRQAFEDLAKAKQKVAEETQEQVKATQKIDLESLRAPVDGTVEQLAIHTVGGVVTPAQALMVVVPDGSQLKVEAMLPNRDVGFVHAGQQAEVKVEAFTYTRYGLLHGTVEGVSRDALRPNSHDEEDHSGRDQEEQAKNQSDRQGSVYVARVTLAQTSVDTEEGASPLEPGMAVTAEIKTGQRRVIDYLLSPLLRYKHESMRER
jgi:hemolysin D